MTSKLCPEAFLTEILAERPFALLAGMHREPPQLLTHLSCVLPSKSPGQLILQDNASDHEAPTAQAVALPTASQLQFGTRRLETAELASGKADPMQSQYGSSSQLKAGLDALGSQSGSADLALPGGGQASQSGLPSFLSQHARLLPTQASQAHQSPRGRGFGNICGMTAAPVKVEESNKRSPAEAAKHFSSYGMVAAATLGSGDAISCAYRIGSQGLQLRARPPLAEPLSGDTSRQACESATCLLFCDAQR